MPRLFPLVALSVLLLSPTAGAQTTEVRAAIDRLQEAAGAPVKTTVSPETGLVTFLTTGARSPVPVVGAAATSPEEMARAFLRSNGAAFGFRSGEPGLALGRPAERDRLGMDHVRFRQTIQGVPVAFGEITVHLRGSDVVAVNAETIPETDVVDVEPGITAEAALDAARELASLRLGRPDAELSEPRLEILNRSLLEDGLEGDRQASRLAWYVEASAFDLREQVWIDAKTGAPLLHFNQIDSARNRTIYTASSTATLPGTMMRIEGGADTGNADVDAAYRYAGDTYDYFYTQHGRDSFDGAGAGLLSTVDYCPSAASCPYLNAFWNGTRMVYGDGFPLADDVDAHEMTHAVTERTANLAYYMQSGALNEAFSDIFGETVDLTNSGGTDTPAVRWQMGEDVPGFGAIRNMMDPSLFGDPGRGTDPNFSCSPNDNGGVHTNSGVLNHFYALLVDGGTYNTYAVTGIGLTKAGKIAYRALTTYLLSGSNFADAANALRQSCADLVGTANITVNDCDQVLFAIAAVELGHNLTCTLAPAAAPPLCPAGQQASNLFFDDFETLPDTSWFNPATSLWKTATGFSTSGTHLMWGQDPNAARDSAITMNPNPILPANARMQFNHAWDFEPYYDGGVLEYSTNGGASWSDARSLFSAGADYDGAISGGSGNPLSGRAAFTYRSHGYTGTQLDLSSLAGQTFRVRFRIGSDFAVAGSGWYLDDVRIYTCTACTYSLSETQVFVGAGGGSGTVSVDAGANACSWTASTSTPWLSVTYGDGVGSGAAGFTALANPSATPRTGSITVAGQTVTVYQGGATDFYTLAPCRLVDTRTSTPLSSGVNRVFAAAGSCGIPSTAKAIEANVTVINQTAGGNVRVYPGGLKLPGISTINFQATGTRANNAILTLAPDGSGTIQGYASMAGGGSVHLIVDVSGYYQ
ncbi:MAG TPA: M4 family metallopeptidase [Thermoanaerobaculia bacterium]|jgi:Zn-dependent metalloprotease|nr:M4 family metallopeptidase [Thermoanaerobaculia bacterium]